MLKLWKKTICMVKNDSKSIVLKKLILSKNSKKLSTGFMDENWVIGFSQKLTKINCEKIH